ncbi:hypothetical protein DICPUDRAFT_152353 [Dictyostelium purpureum]|uniref:Uncharacterized protein n=1 Tax=Dictyostelium purpureum TaxID=5786 RepID=F0ZL52_DICPU|nr:uncharacterized protein DICPUDRAFT_152353 [Dictyostelium purpureum]EGC35346.1 hypothetical protein DICPUDRAFT_152353 [Dictyostelium purpureum]|eukprot:XP_003288153.1 hypothetical protein DICPUDRAFT_152353 [Dictyostelium purpureum]
MKNYFICILFLYIFLNSSIIKAQYNYNHVYYINGTGDDISNSCTEDSQCYSIDKVVYVFLQEINGYYYYSNYPPLTIYMGEGASVFSNVDFRPSYPSSSSSSYSSSPIGLYGFNFTLIGTSEGGVGLINNNSFPFFSIETDFQTKQTYLNFININYGAFGNAQCLSSNAANSTSITDSADFIELSALYNVLVKVTFENFTYSCKYNDKAFIMVQGEPNPEQSASEDWTTFNTAYSFPSTLYSFSFINSVFQNSFGSVSLELASPILNSTYCPVTLEFIQSSLSSNVQPQSPLFLMGRGQLIVEKSNFFASPETSSNCYEPIFQMGNVEVYFNDNQVSMWPVHQSTLINCDGCFFTGVSNNISSTFFSSNRSCASENQSLFSFSRSSSTILNSNITMDELYPSTISAKPNLIYASQSQISLRSNYISSTIGSALNYQSVKSFMFSNVFSSKSFNPYVNCDKNYQNSFNGDKFSTDIGSNHGSNCNSFVQKQKLQNAFIFSAIGVGGTFGSLLFLYISRYIIRRCSGPIDDNEKHKIISRY